MSFEFEENRINIILPKYKGYNIGFSMTFINKNTIRFREEQYIKQ